MPESFRDYYSYKNCLITIQFFRHTKLFSFTISNCPILPLLHNGYLSHSQCTRAAEKMIDDCFSVELLSD
jgi:hypothetical protein